MSDIEFDTYSEALEWVENTYGKDITIASINRKELKIKWHEGIAEDGTDIWRDESFNTEEELDEWVAYYKNDKEVKVLPPTKQKEFDRLWKLSLELLINEDAIENAK